MVDETADWLVVDLSASRLIDQGGSKGGDTLSSTSASQIVHESMQIQPLVLHFGATIFYNCNRSHLRNISMAIKSETHPSRRGGHVLATFVDLPK